MHGCIWEVVGWKHWIRKQFNINRQIILVAMVTEPLTQECRGLEVSKHVLHFTLNWPTVFAIHTRRMQGIVGLA